MSQFVVEELKEQPGQDVVELLTRAYLVNPMHVAVFSGEAELLGGNRKLFSLGVPAMKGSWLCVREGSVVVGVAHYTPFPECSPPPEAQAERGRIMAQVLGESATLVAEWRQCWAEAHPAKPHWHLGPIGVTPKYQRRGIGSLLMAEYCRRMDTAKVLGYLETDVPRNVPFYEKFGFKITGQADAIGVTSWFMERIAKGTE